MLKNNIELDLKTKCIEGGKSQAQVAEDIGITPAYVNRIVKNKEQIINKTFLAIMDDFGYDVRLVYEKKEVGEKLDDR